MEDVKVYDPWDKIKCMGGHDYWGIFREMPTFASTWKSQREAHSIQLPRAGHKRRFQGPVSFAMLPLAAHWDWPGPSCPLLFSARKGYKKTLWPCPAPDCSQILARISAQLLATYGKIPSRFVVSESLLWMFRPIRRNEMWANDNDIHEAHDASCSSIGRILAPNGFKSNTWSDALLMRMDGAKVAVAAGIRL